MPEIDEKGIAYINEEYQRLKALLDERTLELNLLRTRFAQYETALKSSHVTVYTQDQNLRYTAISNPMLGRSIQEIIGCTDYEILPADSSAEIIDLKREALSTGQAKRVEISLDEGPCVRWHDLHIEPLRNDGGEIFGLTCASVDVTERKEAEAHLRLLLRELTHRSKNLLAVIQAMARQTAHHTGSIESFLNQFGSRLQALAASHDLLVRESWYGASLRELVQSQLAAYMAGDGEQILIEGPAVALKPEAAQNLGLALHELAINAAKFGALSVPHGRVSIVWDRYERADSNGIMLDWHEELGPKVKVRRKKGFGSMVIERNLTRSLDAEVSLDFQPDGLHCHIRIPENQIVASR